MFTTRTRSIQFLLLALASTSHANTLIPLTDEDIFTRVDGESYSINGRIHFLSDLITSLEIMNNEAVTREFELYNMNSPSMTNFATTIDKLKEKSFSFDSITKELADTPPESSNSMYSKENTGYYYLNRGFLAVEDLDSNQPLTSNGYPRTGQFEGSDRNTFVGNPHTFVYNHFSKYCDNYGNSSQELCKTIVQAAAPEGADTSVNTNNPSADINAESLFSKNNPEHASDFIQNLTDPFPTNSFEFKDEKVKSDIDFEKVAGHLTDKAFRSLSQYVLSDIKNRHMAQSSSSEDSSSGDNELSLHSLIEDMATSRFDKNNNWLVQIESTSTEGLLREIAIIEASRLLIDFVKFKQNEHMEALLSAMIIQNQNITQASDMSAMMDSPEVQAGNATNADLLNNF